MEPLSIGILIVIMLLVLEVAVMLVKLKVDKMLLLMSVIGVIFAVISFALNETRGKIPLSDSASSIVIYVTVAAGVILGLFSVAVWFRGEKEARRIVSAAKSIDSAVAGIESDIRGSNMEIEHFGDEMSAIKTKMEDYESKEKEV